jgi:hypothetical protein
VALGLETLAADLRSLQLPLPPRGLPLPLLPLLPPLLPPLPLRRLPLRLRSARGNSPPLSPKGRKSPSASLAPRAKLEVR